MEFGAPARARPLFFSYQAPGGDDGALTIEKAAALKKRKILWESLREQQVDSGNLVPTIRGPGMPQGFAASTAEVTGMSKRGQELSLTFSFWRHQGAGVVASGRATTLKNLVSGAGCQRK